MSSLVARYSPRVSVDIRERVSIATVDAKSTEREPSRSSDGSVDGIAAASPISDEAILSRLGSGDKDALDLLFRRYARLVHSVANKVLRDTFEADDLVQEIFLLIYKNCATFDPSKSPARFWILRMTYHRAISRRRYLNCRHFYSQLDLEEAKERNPQGAIGRFEESIDLQSGRSEFQKILESLSKNQRLTLTRYFFDGYTLEEIAAELGQTRENVRHHYFRGLDKLRKHIFAHQAGH